MYISVRISAFLSYIKVFVALCTRWCSFLFLKLLSACFGVDVRVRCASACPLHWAVKLHAHQSFEPWLLSVFLSFSLALSLWSSWPCFPFLLCICMSPSSSPFLYLVLFLSLSSFFLCHRLCKVQLWVGESDLQTRWQKDPFSEYAVLGSLCVTLFLCLFSYTLTWFLFWEHFLERAIISKWSRFTTKMFQPLNRH